MTLTTLLCINAGGILLFVFWGSVLFLMCTEWFKVTRKKSTTFRIFGMLYIATPMLGWVSLFHHSQKGIAFLLCFLGAVCLCDIFAFIGGKIFKGVKFAPKISPNKTWSGVIVGCTVSGGCAYYFFSHFVFNHTNTTTIGLALCIPIATVLGDLVQSKVKRILGIKDMGTFIPGHGGACDRLDGFLLASWIFFLCEILFELNV